MREDEKELHEVELAISKALRIGVIVSGVVTFAGLMMYFATGESGYPESVYPVKFIEILKGMLALKPYGIIMAGLLILIATPIFRVGISIVIFLVEKDYLYVKITLLVFIILMLSLLLGKAG
jgi:uncharacterized membrane protein